MLNFNPAWRFHSPGPIAPGVENEFYIMIKRVAAQHPRQQHVLEQYKTAFAAAAGRPAHVSSSLSWAESDLADYMTAAAENAPLFIEAFYDAGALLQRMNPEFVVPDPDTINRILAKYSAGYEVQPPNLIARNPLPPIAVPDRALSLDAQAQEIIQKSLKKSEEDLALGHGRQAVQEILWLLETVSTAFQGLPVGDGTVEGKYFNKIVDDLRRHHRGKTLDQVLHWTMALHGYLSSPTGGGVRHGASLKAEMAMSLHDARLFCNLIRSYIGFLMAEHERLSQTGTS